MENLKLKAKIIEKGFTYANFAEAIKMHRTSLWKKIRGKREFTESEIQLICKTLKTQPYELFFKGEFAKSQQEEET